MCPTRFGGVMQGNTQDLIQRYLYWFGVWEPQLTCWIKSRLPPRRVFVDVGANIGYYSLLAASLVGDDGQVVAIEASPSIYRLLCNNLELIRAIERPNCLRRCNRRAWASDHLPRGVWEYRGEFHHQGSIAPNFGHRG